MAVQRNAWMSNELHQVAPTSATILGFSRQVERSGRLSLLDPMNHHSVTFGRNQSRLIHHRVTEDTEKTEIL